MLLYIFQSVRWLDKIGCNISHHLRPVVAFEILNSKFMFRRAAFEPISEVQVVNCVQIIYKIIVMTF